MYCETTWKLEFDLRLLQNLDKPEFNLRLLQNLDKMEFSPRLLQNLDNLVERNFFNLVDCVLQSTRAANEFLELRLLG